GKIIADSIVNYSRHPFRRIDLVIGVGYQNRIANVKAVITAVIKADTRVDKSRDMTVRLGELGASSLNFFVRVWVRNGDYWSTYYDLLENIKEALDENNIDIPYPQMDIRMVNSVTESQTLSLVKQQASL
ncbi:MAG TPA: mechanosensitive ion channel protein MscS, partial [Franconibacter pulveris]|nr:mechanosensitive ion channel protein MscS [Franconibacter pulveris]